MNQGALFDETLPPNSGPRTSAAAALNFAGRAGTWRRRVLEWIIESGGSTIEEAELHFRKGGNTIRPRFWELCGNPLNADPPRPVLIEKTDDERPTLSGQMATVYRAL